MRGKFIVIEGPDGAGLSTQAELLANWIKKKRACVLTKEPTDNLIGGLIRAALKNEWKTSFDALQLLFSADRAHHLKSDIIPALEKGKWVICDRYMLSTICYGAASGVDVDWLKELNKNFLRPDLTIVLDVPVEVSLERMKVARFGAELFEKRERLMRVRDNYHKFKDLFGDSVMIDGTRSIKEIHEEIKRVVIERLGHP